MALRSLGQGVGQQLTQQMRLSSRVRWCSTNTGGAARVKKPEQMTEEELKQSLPSMLFTTSNLIWSTTLAVGVAAGGLLAMFWVGTFITGAAKSLKHLEEQPKAAPVPQQPKSLAELIAERKAELQSQLDELQQLPRTPEVKQALAEVKKELRQYRDPSAAWWRWW